MKKFFTAITNHRKTVITLFLLAAVICLGLKSKVAVNYVINDYLPEDAPSTVAIDLMGEEFDGGIPNARAMVSDVTIPEALEYKEKIAAVDGVTDVTWLDDVVDITLPLETMDASTVENYYKDNYAVFSITIDEDARVEATADIREIIGEDNALSGDAPTTADSTTNTVSEIYLITVVAVLMVLAILIVTTTSWAEPIIVLVGLGVAVFINNGTNLIFGEISFVSNSAGSVLQLAVSLDYSVFLMHRFDECRKEFDNPQEAMVDALCKSLSSILSSGLTTVIGFIALVLMQFRLGPDLGLVLAKGVLISLITVFIFMPCFILNTYKWLDKTQHRRLLPSFRGLGKVVYKISIPMAVLFALVIAPSYMASNANDYYYGASHIYGEDTRIGADTAAIQDVFGDTDTYVLLVPTGDTATETALSNDLHELSHVTGIISYVDLAGAEIPLEYLDEDSMSQLASDNYSRLVLSVDVPVESEESFALVEDVRTIAEKYYPGTYYLAGAGVSTYDLKTTVTDDTVKVNLVSILAVYAVLALMLHAWSVPLLLVLCIETAIWLNLSISYFLDMYVFYLAYLIISSLQLGATVDYAILITNTYKENRATLGKKESVIKTIADSTTSVITSGGALTIVGFMLGLFSSNQLMSQLGTYIGRGALLSLTIVLFILPGLLSIFDRIVIGQKKEKKKKKHSKSTHSKEVHAS